MTHVPKSWLRHWSGLVVTYPSREQDYTQQFPKSQRWNARRLGLEKRFYCPEHPCVCIQEYKEYPCAAIFNKMNFIMNRPTTTITRESTTSQLNSLLLYSLMNNDCAFPIICTQAVLSKSDFGVCILLPWLTFAHSFVSMDRHIVFQNFGCSTWNLHWI